MEAHKLSPYIELASVESKDERVKLTQKFLLLPYCLMLAVILLVIVDAGILGGVLKRNLPTYPDYFFIYWVIFNYPHIVASNIVIFNKDYVSHYKKNMLIGIAGAVAIVIATPLTLGYTALQIVYGIFTIGHTTGQQLGMSRIGLKSIGWEYSVWKYSAILLANICFIRIYLTSEIFNHWSGLILTFYLSSAVILTGSFLLVLRDCKEPWGRRFVCGNQLLIGSTAILAFTGYPFFAVLIPRMVHDLCAFQTYWVHDQNRLKAGKKLTINIPKHWRIPKSALTPIAAIVLALPISLIYQNPYGELVAIAISLVHYSNEHFVWRKGSPLREYVPMS